MKLTFFGGAKWVTGANYLLDTGPSADGKKIVVDCGLFQGSKYAEDKNYSNFGFDPAEIDCVFVTHSHIDHIGRLPKLFKDGFRGKIYTTAASKDLISISLPDSFKHIVMEAEDEGHPPLFEESHVNQVLSSMDGIEYDVPINVGNVQAIFRDAGHVLGAASIEMMCQGNDKSTKIVFSGDLGNTPAPIIKPTEFIRGADYAIIESAYGDRLHEPHEERYQRLKNIIRETIERKGVLMIPSFALERTQDLLFHLNGLFNDKIISEVPVFIDSPLAIKLTEVYKKHVHDLNDEAQKLIKSGDDIFDFPSLKLTPSVEESKAINDVPPPKIIIAGSGMSHGGRILHHEMRYLSDPKSTILLVGYQVDGSLGRRIQKGYKSVSIFGQNIPINCRVETLSSFSAHADQKQLMDWITALSQDGKLKQVFTVQGEEVSSTTLASLIKSRLGVEARSADEGETVELD